MQICSIGIGQRVETGQTRASAHTRQSTHNGNVGNNGVGQLFNGSGAGPPPLTKKQNHDLSLYYNKDYKVIVLCVLYGPGAGGDWWVCGVYTTCVVRTFDPWVLLFVTL